MTDIGFVRTEMVGAKPAPVRTSGAIAWAQKNLFSTPVDTILTLVRERPLLASGAAVAAGIYALRNPQLIAAVLRAFMDKPSNPKR